MPLDENVTVPAKLPTPSSSDVQITEPKKAESCAEKEKTEENKKSSSVRLFHDEIVNSFFRRPCFSPDGLFLYLPSGELSRRTLCLPAFSYFLLSSE